MLERWNERGTDREFRKTVVAVMTVDSDWIGGGYRADRWKEAEDFNKSKIPLRLKFNC